VFGPPGHWLSGERGLVSFIRISPGIGADLVCRLALQPAAVVGEVPSPPILVGLGTSGTSGAAAGSRQTTKRGSWVGHPGISR
jgi:hypothetical protein